MAQNEITTPLSVLDSSGQPQNFGWSREPGFFYDPALIWGPRRRISESDRYILHSPTHMVVFEIRDDGWLGYMGISVISLRDKKRSTQIYRTLLPMGSYEMPTGSVNGSTRYRRNKANLDFISMENGVKIIKADIKHFGHHRSLRGQVVLSEPAASESIVTNQRWYSEKNSFRYTRCSPWYIAEGVIQFGGTEIIFTRGNGWGIFNWNRGVRPGADIHYWSAGCGMAGDRQVSFSAGYSWADSSTGTENGLFVDGKLHKLDKITFHIPPSNWLSPWRFTSNDNRLEMLFTPHQGRTERSRLFFYNSTRRQFFGFFSGKALLDDGSILDFNNITGFAERSKLRF
ncbi:MAG: DUF2804 domain-containing protein [Treponema sp.]|nr:DUF2804 domain-containing protein [Treponema sp.]